MIFFRKLFPRPARSKRKGSITVWLALSFLVFLSLYLICLQSVQKQSAKRRAEQAVENGMFSLFSEYEPHLLDKWDLFYIDTSFRSGTEKREELCSHLWKFIQENITGAVGKPLDGLELQGINFEDLIRATDGGGAVFYQQAIEVMKEKSGTDLMEDWLLQAEQREELLTQAEEMQRDYEESRRVVMDYDDEDDELSGEASSWSSFLDGFFFYLAVPSGSTVSEKTINIWIPGQNGCMCVTTQVMRRRSGIRFWIWQSILWGSWTKVTGKESNSDMICINVRWSRISA